MKRSIYRWGTMFFDLSKKARPPPGDSTPQRVNCQTTSMLRTIPLPSSAFCGRGHFCVFPKRF
ncbi:hypothetical protein D3Z48_17975 [Clostridiaceae bacterium]|nr:hypothetical protein [Clostridiaceae bacterium]